MSSVNIKAERARLAAEADRIAALASPVKAILEAMTPEDQCAVLKTVFTDLEICGRCFSAGCSGWCDYSTPLDE